MPLSKEEQAELEALEAKVSTPTRISPMQMKSQISKGRQMQSAPRTLAYGPQFERAPATGGLEDIDKGAYEAGGRVTDLAASSSITRPIAPTLGTLVRMIPDIATSFGGGGATKAAAKPFADYASHELMFSALKPSAAGSASVAENMGRVNTMLEGGYNVSAAGVEKMHGKLSELESDIRSILKKSPEKTTLADISAQNPASRESFVLQRDQQTVDRVFDQIKKKYFPKGEISVEDAHLLKQKIYKNVKEKSYASGELQSAEKEGLMGAARGIRESELRAGVGPQLKEQQKLMDVLEPAEKRAIVELRNNPVGIALLAHNPKMMALYIGDRSSAFKSAVANLIHQSNVSGKLGTAGTSLYDLSTQNAGSSAGPF